MKDGKAVIFGCNNLGLEVAEILGSKVDNLVLVDDCEEQVKRAIEKGFNASCLDYTDDGELVDLGIGDDISIIFCFFPADHKNVFLTISARSLDPNLQIVSATQSRNSIQKLIAAGASKVIDPYEISGRLILDLLYNPEITLFLGEAIYKKEILTIGEIEIPENSFLLGTTLQEYSLNEHYNLIPISIVDKVQTENPMFNTRGISHRVEQGDILIVIGPAEEIERLRGELAVVDTPAHL